MKLDYVDIFYSHRFDPETPLEETMGALDSAVRQGKALYAGISSYNPDQTRRAAQILRGLGTPCLIHQPSYNMFDRWVEGGLLDVLLEEGIGCIVFSPLAQGQLTDRYLKGIPTGARATKTERVWLARAIPGADGHCLGSAKTRRDHRIDRRKQREAAGR
jgi:L-glyceraldehyde 3-phosphate reductase